jgi:hypothetical protein
MLTIAGTATAFSLRLRLHYKAVRAGGVISEFTENLLWPLVDVQKMTVCWTLPKYLLKILNSLVLAIINPYNYL